MVAAAEFAQMMAQWSAMNARPPAASAPMFPQHMVDRVRLAGGANVYGSSRNMLVSAGDPLTVADGSVIDFCQEVPQRWVVTLGPIVDAAGALATGIHTPQAVLNWGHGGVQFQTFIDWPHSGGTFTISASSLVLGARAIPVTAIPTRPSNALPIFFKAMAVPAVGGESMHAYGTPRLSVATGSILSGQFSASFPLPRFARTASLFTFGGFAGTPQQVHIEYAAIGIPALLNDPRNVNLGIPGGAPAFVPSSATSWRVFNNTGAALTNVFVEFSLTLG